MTVRRLAIDRGELEFALTWRSDEGAHYLDLTTGEVIAWMGSEDEELSEEQIDAGLAEGRLVTIEPLEPSVEHDWMCDFVSSIADRNLRRLLETALDGPGAFRRFKNVLAGQPAERERWFTFRDERLAAAAQEWLREHDLERVDNPDR
jgi:hypothetical protein